MKTLLLEALLFGILGLLVEDIFTGIKSFIRGDRRGTTTSYLYMPVVWAAGGLLFRFLSPSVAGAPLVGQWLLWVMLIYVVEGLSGAILKKVLGVVPWSYSSQKGAAFGGTINLWYAPFWIGLAVGVRPVLAFVHELAVRILA